MTQRAELSLFNITRKSNFLAFPLFHRRDTGIMAGFLTTGVKPLPSNWHFEIKMKVPAKDEKLGYIDPIERGTTFRFVSPEDKAVAIKPVRSPYECFTVADCLGKGRGKLTTRIQLNAAMWKSLSELDKLFKNFLIENRFKLFNSSDADFIGKDHTAIALKYKNLAPVTPEGAPHYDAFITVRINGRGGEIEELVCKEGSSGRYVSSVTWAGRTSPLATGATRFSIVTGYSAVTNKPQIRETLPIAHPVPVGAQRVRYVGPGDISEEGCVLRYATLRPAYWSLAPGGAASLTIVADHLVIENMSGENPTAPAAYSAVPEGFDEAPACDDHGVSMVTRSNAVASEAAPAPRHTDKRARLAPVSEEDERTYTPKEAAAILVKPAPRAPVAGGFFSRSTSIAAAGGGGAVRREQEEFEARVEREHQHMRRTSAIRPEDSQMPEPFAFEDDCE